MPLAKALLISLTTCIAAVAADPFVGTWIVNAEDTKAKSGTPPASQQATFEPTADGYVLKVNNQKIVLHLDGKDYSRTVGATARAVGVDAASARRINDRTIETSFKRGGKVVATIRREVSADGRVLMATADGVYSDGKKMKNVIVYHKR